MSVIRCKRCGALELKHPAEKPTGQELCLICDPSQKPASAPVEESVSELFCKFWNMSSPEERNGILESMKFQVSGREKIAAVRDQIKESESENPDSMASV